MEPDALLRSGAGIEPLARWAYGYSRSVAFGPDGIGVTMQGSVFQTLDLSTPTAITVMGELEFPGVISDMSVQGDMAYVVLTHFQNTETGLFVVDISDPENPVRRGGVTGLAATSVEVQGDYAYVGTYNTVADSNLSLRVISITDPDAPAQVAQLETASFAEDMAFYGGRVYLALNSAGLGIVDITTPEAPRLVESGITAYTGAVTVNASGTLATGERLSSGRGRVVLYSLDDPDSPAELGSVNLPSRADPLDALWVGTDIAVAGLFGSLVYVDASDTAAPTVSQTVSTSRAFSAGGANRVAVEGDRILVADFYSGVLQGSVAQRQLTGFLKGGGLAVDLVVDDETDRIYSAQGSAGVLALERVAPAGGPERLDVVGSIHGTDWNYTTGIALQLNHLYAADGFAGIWAIDKFTLQTTANLLRNTPIRKVAVTEDGDLLLAIEDNPTQTVHVFSLDNPAVPVKVSTIEPLRGAADVGGTGPVVWISDVTDTRMRLYDMSTPATPQPLTSISLTGSGFRFARTNDRLYALGTGIIANILDVSTPSSPVVLGEASSVRSQEALAGQANILLLAGLGVAAYNVDDPSSPVETAFSSDYGDVIAEIEYVEPRVAAVAVNHAGVATLFAPEPVSTTAGPLATGLSLSVGPNPSRGAVQVRLASGAPEAVDVAVFDVLGRRVRTLATGLLVAPEADIAWDGRNDAGAPLASGVYVMRAKGASGAVTTARLTIVR